MRLWYSSHRRPAKAQASLRIRSVSPEPSLFGHMKDGSRRRVRPKIRHLTLLDGCSCAFKKLVYGGRKVPQSHDMVYLLFFLLPSSDFWPYFLQPVTFVFSFHWLFLQLLLPSSVVPTSNHVKISPYSGLYNPLLWTSLVLKSSDPKIVMLKAIIWLFVFQKSLPLWESAFTTMIITVMF